jgi:adenylate cyclase
MNSHHGWKIPFLEQLQRRHVGRVALLYIGIAYVLLEAFAMFFHLLELPSWVGRSTVLLVVLGFPVTLIFAWAYEITPEGIKPALAVEPSPSIARQTGRRLDRAIIVVLAVALTYFVVDKYWHAKRASSGEAQEGRRDGHPEGEAAAAGAAGTQAAAAPAGASGKSIAVLPFVNMSADKDQEYFSDGLTEELIDHLAHSRDLHVIARTSSFYFKGKQVTIAEIANALHVSHVLEGSVRKSGQQLRITAQLIRASDGTHLWSQTFDRKLADIFRIQDEIAKTVAKALEAALLADNSREANRPASLEAYNLILQGRHFRNQHTSEGDRAALQDFQRATVLDPAFAEAWAELGRAYMEQEGIGPDARAAKARSAIDHALRLNPDLVRAHLYSFSIHFRYDIDLVAARKDIEQVQRLDPRVARRVRVNFEALVNGRPEDAIEARREAALEDPLDADAVKSLADYLWWCDRYDESIETFQRLLHLYPRAEIIKALMGLDLASVGRKEEALKVIREEQDPQARAFSLAIVYWEMGRRAESDVALRELTTRFGDDAAYGIAVVHANRGQLDEAFAWLEKARLRHDGNLITLRLDRMLRPLHPDPRFQQLLQRMSFVG